MSEPVKLTLGGTVYEVDPPPLGVLKKIISAINRVAQSPQDIDVMMAEAPVAVGLLIGRSAEEMDAMPVGFQELVAAFNRVPDICGLAKNEGEPDAGE